MNRRTIITTLIAVTAVVAIGAGLYARATEGVTPGRIAVAGDVRVDEYTVRAPQIVQPVPDFSVGAPTTASVAAARKRAATPPAPSASRLPVVSGYLTEVAVTQGARVKKGQVVARLDTAMLDLGVAQARTALTKARADLGVLDANVDKLADARAKLVKAKAQLVKARASLVATITMLQRQDQSLETSIAGLQALVDRPGGPPPHNPPYPVILQQMKIGLAALHKGLAGARIGLAKMDQGLAKMAKGLAQIDTARTKLRDIRKVAKTALEGQDVAVRLAEARRAAAVITSPVDGVVTFARIPGTAVMVGAPIVRIRPDGPAHVFTYLASDQLREVGVGSAANVDFDSNTDGPISGRIVEIGDKAVVPPTGFPTSIVHMTRAVRVTIALDGSRAAPPGTPVDVEIFTGTSR